MFGLPRYLFDIVDALKDDPAFEITLLLNKEIVHFKGAAVRHDVFGPAYSKLKFIWEHLQCPRHLNDFDIFHQPNNVGIPRLRSNIKKVLTVHDITPLFFPQTHTKIGAWYWQNSLKNSLKNADEIITVSKTVKSQLLERFPSIDPEMVKPIYNCTHVFSKSGLKDIDVLKKYNVNGDKYYSYHGGYRVHKNSEIIIDSFNIIAGNVNDVKLLLIGKLPDNILEKIHKSHYKDRIITTGFISDEEMGALLKNAHFTLSPSLMEGFNYPPTEALVCNTLPLVSDIPINREILQDQACYFDPHSVDSLVKQCEKYLLKEKFDPQTKNASEYLEKYSGNNFSEQYCNFYKSIIDK